MKAVVLAAGLSRRMKTQKLLLPFGRGTVLSTVVYNVMAAMFDEVVLVVSKETQNTCADFLPAPSPRVTVTEIMNEAPERGQASSLKLGLSAVGEGDFCVMLGDLPLVSSVEILRHRALFDARGPGYTALVPRRDGRPGHPSFFSAVWRDRLRAAEGDAGGRALIAAYDGEVLCTEGEESFFADIDTPEEYGQMAAKRL